MCRNVICLLSLSLPANTNKHTFRQSQHATQPPIGYVPGNSKDSNQLQLISRSLLGPPTNESGSVVNGSLKASQWTATSAAPVQ